MKIRESSQKDNSAINDLYLKAFGEEKGQEIADLVNDLLKDKTAMPILSLLAEDNAIQGHILFTKVSISGAPDSLSAQILAPLAVMPENQSKGIGAALINEGLKRLKEAKTDLVFVLGHPTYYPKCGFKNDAGAKGYEAPYTIPEEHADAWMVLELSEGIMGDTKGMVKCADALSDPKHWRE